jgi:acetoin utilization deacetylase AcuC-like enzyme
MVYLLGGGQHHARVNGPSGFCLLNDVSCAALRVVADLTAPTSLVWIIDVDCHKGDGTAEIMGAARRGELPVRIFTGRNPEVINLSIHMARGWPLDKETLAAEWKNCGGTGEPDANSALAVKKAPFAPSAIDIGMEAGEDALYNPRLREGLVRMEALSDGRKPALAIVVDGDDVYEHDGLASSGLINLTLEQCFERDMLIYEFLRERGVPSAWLLAGGYGERAWEPAAHFLAKLSGAT